MKPYISLNEKFPGIVSLFMYDNKIAKRLTALGQEIMRRTDGLSPGDRELIAAFVSRRNDCEFCYRSHEEAAAELGNPSVVHQVIDDEVEDNLPAKMRALLMLAENVRKLDRSKLEESIAHARHWDATEQEIHDTVFIASFFSMCNRYVDGLGTTFKKGEPEKGGHGLAKYGYTMGVRRFFREVLPTLFKKEG